MRAYLPGALLDAAARASRSWAPAGGAADPSWRGRARIGEDAARFKLTYGPREAAR